MVRVALSWMLLYTMGACADGAPAPVEPALQPSAKRTAPEATKAPTACRPGPELTIVESTPTASELDDSPRARTHEVWRAMIDDAKKTLDIEQFYLSNNEGGRLEPVILAIERAAARGVAVRVLADASFGKTYPETLDRLATGATVRRFDVSANMGGVQHAKYFVVDGCDAYFGSANFDWRSLEHIHELGLRIKSEPFARALGEVFELDWALAGGEKRPNPTRSFAAFPITLDGDQELVPAFSPQEYLPDPRSWDLNQLVQAIREANKRVRVELLSYEPVDKQGKRFEALENELKAAGKRGVSVELVVSHWDTRAGRIEHLKELAQSPGVAVRIATIPEHPQGFIPFARVIHAKYMVVDDQLSWLGTSNWSADYFFRSRNVGVIVRGERLAQALGEIFDDLWKGPYAQPVDPQRSYPSPRISR
jgi:phosphatidylserine/phosphatidylglycerophosphate/cardiolipin synthase-like enzyme